MKLAALPRILGAAALLAASACGGSAPFGQNGSALPAGKSSGSVPIKHVVIVVQENRSFDDLFALFPGANGATRGKRKVKQGTAYVDKWTPLKAHSLVMPTDIQHCHKAFLTSYDGGAMDGFNLVDKGVCPTGSGPVGTLAYQYVKESEIQPYWDIASQWVLADAMFQTQGSGSFTAHQDLIRGDTAIDSDHSLIDNPTGMPWGCDASPNTVTSLITAQGQVQKNAGPFPCSNKFPGSGASYTTLRDVLDAQGVSWKYYSPCFSARKCSGSSGCTDCAGGLLNAFDVIAAVRYGSEWASNVSIPETNIFNDISGGTLPAVSWVIPEDANSDHPGDGKVDNGPAWVASVVNAVGESSYWNSTVVIVVWDDWGGFYDNAVPQQFSDLEGGLGFRVPALIVSAYDKSGGSKGGYVSHTQYEFGSILKYAEQTFGLGSLGTTDVRANSISDVFNYNQQPRAFTPIASALGPRWFQTHREANSLGDPQ